MAAKKPSSSAPSPSNRPLASSPAPEFARVDPGSAATEYMKSLLPPDAPLPVFSTMALMHGRGATGAAALREGFAWNPQMDLLWALAYPEVLLIVDGFPAEDTPDAHLDYWDPQRRCATEGGDAWRKRAAMADPRCLSRRGAWAVLWELEHQRSPFSLSAEEFMTATEPRPLDPAEGKDRILTATSHEDMIAPAAHTVEALAGPDCVVDALCTIAEKGALAVDVRCAATATILPLLRRLPAPSRADALTRLEAVADASGTELEEYISSVVNARAYAEERIQKGRSQYALTTLRWLDEPAELVEDCHRALLAQRPDVPNTRTVFPGGNGVIELEVAHFGKYDKRDVVKAYVRDYTTLRSPRLLGPELQLLSGKESRPPMQAWFRAHARDLRSELEKLRTGTDAKQAKAAAAALGKD